MYLEHQHNLNMYNYDIMYITIRYLLYEFSIINLINFFNIFIHYLHIFFIFYNVTLLFHLFNNLHILVLANNRSIID